MLRVVVLLRLADRTIMAEPLAEPAPASAWSVSRHLSRFHRTSDAKLEPVAPMKERIEAFMRYWDARCGSWSTLVPGGDQPWTGRIEFPSRASLPLSLALA